MSRADVARRARLLIARELLTSPARLTDATEFRALGADDKDMAVVRTAAEAEFGIKITLRELAFCETVGTLSDLIETKLENRGVTA